MSRRTTPGTTKRNLRMIEEATKQIEKERLLHVIDKLVGCYGKMPSGKVVEIVGVTSFPLVEWLAGDEFGESHMLDLTPTDELPPHVKAEF